MINIAKWSRPLYYFWVFGIISVLLDLDHAIKVYEDGLEINLENMWHHGTRALHIPILILSGCLLIIVFTLFIRFWYLSTRPDKISIARKPINEPMKILKPEIIYVKCPKCKNLMGVIAATDSSEFPCVNCGIMGSLKVHAYSPVTAIG